MELNREEADKSMSEAKERFKSDDLFGATQLAKRAQSPYPSLPDLSNFIVTLRVLSTAAIPHRPQTTPPITPSSAPKPTDTIHAIKHKYHKLCIQTHPDKNPTPHHRPTFKPVHQARNALNNKPKVKNSTTTATGLNLEEAKRARAEAEERFKANQMVEAIVLAQRAYKLYPLLPGLDNFIVDLRILAVHRRMTIVPSDNSAWHAILESKKTDSFEVVKNKYRVLCERTNSVGNLNVAAETAFRIGNQAWDAPMNRGSSNSCPQRLYRMHLYT